MARSSRLSWILGPLLVLVATSSRAQVGDEDDVASRREELLALLREVEKSHRRSPSILGEVDSRRSPAVVRRLARRLRSARLSFKLENEKLEDVVKTLRTLSGLNYVITAKARRALASEKTVSMSVTRLSVENVLNLLSRRLKSCRFTIREGAVVLVHRDEYRPQRILRVYYVGDLLRRPPDFAAPRLALGNTRKK